MACTPPFKPTAFIPQVQPPPLYPHANHSQSSHPIHLNNVTNLNHSNLPNCSKINETLTQTNLAKFGAVILSEEDLNLSLQTKSNHPIINENINMYLVQKGLTQYELFPPQLPIYP